VNCKVLNAIGSHLLQNCHSVFDRSSAALPYHALEAEHASLVLAEDAITGLRQALAGQFVSDEELDQALGVASAP